MKKLILATTASTLFFAGIAHAADAVEAPPAPPIAQEVYTPASTWGGFNAGVFGGYQWGETDVETSGFIDNKADVDGAMGGVFAGYNWQSGNIVYGVEGDLGYSGAKTDDGLGGEAEQKLLGSARAKLGYALDPVLVYGTAGVAAAQFEAEDGAGNSDKNTHVGWTAGVGADALLTEKVFGRLEYRYTDYAEKDYNFGGTKVSSGFDEHSVRAGIGFKF